MNEPLVKPLEDLGAEFDRVSREHPKATSKRSWGPIRHGLRIAPRNWALAVGVGGLLLACSAYAVPETRAAIDDVTGTFAAWVTGDADKTPGRALRPEDDAPGWVRDDGGRLIAETDGVSLYVTRETAPDGQVYLEFGLDEGVGLSDTVEGWRKRFDERAIVILGPTPYRQGQFLDKSGRFPLLGVTARSVDRLELRYADGPAQEAETGPGGFVAMADARRALREVVAYDDSGKVLDTADATHLDMRYLCSREPDRCR